MKCFQIHDFYLAYGDIKVLKCINMQIEKNKITAFIGPSGCGKSSFIRSLNRMNDMIETIDMQGEILFEACNILTTSCDVKQLRSEIGMVFQKPNPFEMSIYQNVAYGLKRKGIYSRKEIKQLVKEALIQAVLWDEVKDDLHANALTLSGDQQQRLCIARAIAIKPKVLLMDEPTSALDPIATAKIEDLLLTLKEKYTIYNCNPFDESGRKN